MTLKKYLLISFYIFYFYTIVDCEVPLAVVYNSHGSQDGAFQEAILRGAFLGLMEADSDDTNLQPIFIDLKVTNKSEAIAGILNKGTKSVLSLLSANQLNAFCHEFLKIRLRIQNTKNGTDTTIFTPRALPNNFYCANSSLKLLSLQPSSEVRALALLNRIRKVQTRVLIPILDDEDQVSLLEIYRRLSTQFKNQIKIKSPIFIYGTNNATDVSRRLHSLLGSYTSANGTGILLLSSKWLPEASDAFWSDDHYFRWFSHTPIQEIKPGYELLLGMYTVQYVGSANWDSPLRRNVIRDIGNITDPTPNVLSAVLAFDAATATVFYAKLGNLVSFKGISGNIEFDVNGFRSGETNFLGISALSKNQSPFAMLLQNSSWILEDAVQIRYDNGSDLYEITDHSIGTSSILPRDSLLSFADKKFDMNSNCGIMEFEVVAHDPFTQHPQRYYFNRQNLPSTLIVTNQFGYGLKLLCKTKDRLDRRVEIACTSIGMSVAAAVNCYSSKIIERKKRDSLVNTPPNLNRKFPNSFNSYNDRDDSSVNSLYNLPPVPTTSAPFYMAAASYEGSASESPVTTTEEATSEAPSEAPPPKLPDLRGILKGVLPFVGACVGGATGCSVCVVVLGRLPLGALPAVCTGPCFVTTFSNCGGLLGRTFAETTVICTELFKQGRLDMETFLVDAEFGNRYSENSLPILQMYQKLAAPVVSAMRSSEIVTSVVEIFARPWANHMLYLMGRSSKFNWLGFLIHSLGIATCVFLNQVIHLFETISKFLAFNTTVWGVFILVSMFAQRRVISKSLAEKLKLK